MLIYQLHLLLKLIPIAWTFDRTVEREAGISAIAYLPTDGAWAEHLGCSGNLSAHRRNVGRTAERSLQLTCRPSERGLAAYDRLRKTLLPGEIVITHLLNTKIKLQALVMSAGTMLKVNLILNINVYYTTFCN